MARDIMKYTSLDPKEVSDVFGERGVQFPRNIRLMSLRRVIEPTLKNQLEALQEKEIETGKTLSIGDHKKLMRLTYPDHLSELQLENEYEVLKDKDLKQAYLVDLWKNIEEYLDGINGDHVLDDLDKLEPKPEALENLKVEDYNNILKRYFRDDAEYLDGLHHSEYRTYLYRSSNIKELVELGAKYNLKVPKSFSKGELKERLLKGLNEKGLLTEEKKAEVEALSIKKIQVWLSENELNDKSYLTKEEVIEFILKNNQQLKYYYKEPVSEDDYGVKKETEVLQEPTKEPVEVEEIKETTETPSCERIIALLEENNKQQKITQEKLDQLMKSGNSNLLDQITIVLIIILGALILFT